jgi:tetratricopeptide (TPR) repeat protein
MKLFFHSNFIVFFILTILIGCATSDETIETNEAALFAEGQALLEVGQQNGDIDRAIANFSKAIEIDPDYAEAYHQRGRAYYYKGQFDKALSDYNKVLEIYRNYPSAYCNRGLVYYMRGQYDQAIVDCSKAIKIDPRMAAAYNCRGLAYGAEGQYDKACPDLKQACELGICRDFWSAKKDSNCK